MGTEDNKALLRELNEYVDRNWGSFDYIGKYLTADFRFHQNGATLDLSTYRHGMSAAFEAFSDMRHEVHFMIGEADKVAVVMTDHMKHTGEFLGIAPAGRTVTAPVNAVYRFHEGKVAEVWMTMDMAGIQQQLAESSEELE